MTPEEPSVSAGELLVENSVFDVRFAHAPDDRRRPPESGDG